jgi:hypothetical protein
MLRLKDLPVLHVYYSVKAVLKELRGESTIKDKDWSGMENEAMLFPVLDRVKNIHRRYWKLS